MRLHAIALAALLLPVLCFAQDDSSSSSSSDQSDNTIHAITALHEDGTRTVTVTNPDNHSSEATTYDARNRLIEKVVYVLDDSNTPITGTVYGPDNQAAFKTTYKHDDYNRIIEEDDFTMDDQLIRRFTYDFGADGKLLRVRGFDSQGNELQQSEAVKDQRQTPPRIH